MCGRRQRDARQVFFEACFISCSPTTRNLATFADIMIVDACRVWINAPLKLPHEMISNLKLIHSIWSKHFHARYSVFCVHYAITLNCNLLFTFLFTVVDFAYKILPMLILLNRIQLMSISMDFQLI